MWRWRPGVLLCLVGTALAAWFVVLNAATAWGALPDVLHGRGVDVVMTACAGGTCRGDYTLSGRRYERREVLGVGSARAGSVVHATVDGDRPGSATVDDPLVGFGEALILALIGLAVAVLGVRATGRAWRRRGVHGAGPVAEGVAAEGVAAEGVAAADDDPLGWVRRRRFGAGG